MCMVACSSLLVIPGYCFSSNTSLIVLTESNKTQVLQIDQINEGHQVLTKQGNENVWTKVVKNIKS